MRTKTSYLHRKKSSQSKRIPTYKRLYIPKFGLKKKTPLNIMQYMHYEGKGKENTRLVVCDSTSWVTSLT